VVTSGERAQLDRLPADQIIDLLLAAELRVLPAVRSAAASIASAAGILADTLRADGRLVFAGAGTSGRLASAEAAELPGTFGLPATRCIAVVAGSSPSGPIDDAAEDDAAAGERAVRAIAVGSGDLLIAVAASGRTPYTLAAATAAIENGARVVAVVTAADTPLARLATAAIETVVGAEVLRGSTRLTAGTAQKIALNTLTTTGMSLAGRVHGDLMIDVVAANAKLHDRAADMVAEIVGCPRASAAAALSACGHNARAAVLHLMRDLTPAEAVAAAGVSTSLRDALDAAATRGGRPSQG
jgi:N-acetylmuramic acid 6-phosphate etherase